VVRTPGDASVHISSKKLYLYSTGACGGWLEYFSFFFSILLFSILFIFYFLEIDF
jgi:hypothetical protein